MRGKHIPKSELKVGGVYICGDDKHKASDCWEVDGKVVPFRIKEINQFGDVSRMTSLDGKKKTFCSCDDLYHLHEWIDTVALTTHEELLKHHGKRVTCEIEGDKIDDAKIAVEGDEVFICQNVKNGDNANNKLGYYYSWSISDKGDEYKDNNRGCTNIRLVDEEEPIPTGREIPEDFIEVERTDTRIVFEKRLTLTKAEIAGRLGVDVKTLIIEE